MDVTWLGSRRSGRGPLGKEEGLLRPRNSLSRPQVYTRFMRLDGLYVRQIILSTSVYQFFKLQIVSLLDANEIEPDRAVFNNFSEMSVFGDVPQ